MEEEEEKKSIVLWDSIHIFIQKVSEEFLLGKKTPRAARLKRDKRRQRRRMSSTIEEFNDPRFDPIHYVNAAARQLQKGSSSISSTTSVGGTKEDDALERLLSELEMRLQLLGEDVSLQLERESQLGVKRIPTAIGEIEVLEENVESLTNAVKDISRSLDETEFPSKQSIERLRKIDEVKSRMERARDTLSEAAGVAELMHSVDSVFNGENVSNMADALVRMKRGLAIVGDVLFVGSIGRTDFPLGNHQALVDAIVTRLWPMGDETVFIPGHGNAGRFGEERRTNPFVADSVLAA